MKKDERKQKKQGSKKMLIANKGIMRKNYRICCKTGDGSVSYGLPISGAGSAT